MVGGLTAIGRAIGRGVEGVEGAEGRARENGSLWIKPRQGRPAVAAALAVSQPPNLAKQASKVP
jgi:hypothetical protein